MLLALTAFGRFQYIYYRYYPWEFAGEWLNPYPPLVRYLQSVENHYDQIFVTSSYGRPYIYFLFYNQMNPADFQTESTHTRTGDAFGFFDVHAVGKYKFDPPDLAYPQPRTLYALRLAAIPPGFKLVTTIPDITGTDQFMIIQSQ